MANSLDGPNDTMTRMSRWFVELYQRPDCGRQQSADDIAGMLDAQKPVGQ